MRDKRSHMPSHIIGTNSTIQAHTPNIQMCLFFPFLIFYAGLFTRIYINRLCCKIIILISAHFHVPYRFSYFRIPSFSKFVWFTKSWAGENLELFLSKAKITTYSLYFILINNLLYIFRWYIKGYIHVGLVFFFYKLMFILQRCIKLNK